MYRAFDGEVARDPVVGADRIADAAIVARTARHAAAAELQRIGVVDQRGAAPDDEPARRLPARSARPQVVAALAQQHRGNRIADADHERGDLANQEDAGDLLACAVGFRGNGRRIAVGDDYPPRLAAGVGVDARIHLGLARGQRERDLRIAGRVGLCRSGLGGVDDQLDGGAYRGPSNDQRLGGREAAACGQEQRSGHSERPQRYGHPVIMVQKTDHNRSNFSAFPCSSLRSIVRLPARRRMAAMVCEPWHFAPLPSGSLQSLPKSSLS